MNNIETGDVVEYIGFSWWGEHTKGFVKRMSKNSFTIRYFDLDRDTKYSMSHITLFQKIGVMTRLLRILHNQ